VAIIDVGWKGSIQDNISLACDKSIVIKGYYIGLSGDVYTDIFNQKKGILFADYPIKSVHYDIWSFDSHFFERLLTASHASVRTYRNKDGNVIPIYNEHGQEKNNYILIKPIQDKILLQSDRLYEHFRSLELTSSEKEKLMAKYHITALTHVNASNMKLQFELLYGQEENFGVQSSNKNIFKEALSFLNLLKQIRKKYKMIKNPVLIMEILNSKGLYFLSALIIRLQERKLRKLL
jgi:hypothetical protein